jgi:cell division transport system permease protein
MNFRNLEFFFKEAFLGLSRNRLMSFVTIGTIIVSLVIYGMFLLGLYNVYSMFIQFQNKLVIMAYAENDMSHTSLNQLKNKIETINGVKTVDFLDKKTVWNQFQQKYKLNANMVGSNSINPLPDTFKIYVTRVEMVENIARYVKTVKGIDDVRYGYTVVKKLKRIIRSVEYGGAVLVVLLGLSTLLIIVNTIRLTVMARQNEIIIMRLVGATDQFIKWPFVIEGLILGLIGSISATLILNIVYGSLISKFADSIPLLMLITGGPVLTIIYMSVVVGGAFLGMLGGSISVSRSLKKIS